MENIAWRELQEELIGGHRRQITLNTAARVSVFWHPDSETVGIRLPDSPAVALPDLAELRGSRAGGVVEFTLNQREDLRPQLLAFALTVAATANTPSDALEALKASAEAMGDLLRPMRRLTTQEEIGLLGELLLLEVLLDRVDSKVALEAWVDSTVDFRLGEKLIEVKTSQASHRTHEVSSLDQLGMSDVIVASLLVGPAGAGDGTSLMELGDRILGEFAGIDRARCAAKLADRGVTAGQSYDRRWAVTGELEFIPVDEHFPLLRRAHIDQVLGDLSPRVSTVKYMVHLDGLGYPLDDPRTTELFDGWNTDE